MKQAPPQQVATVLSGLAAKIDAEKLADDAAIAIALAQMTFAGG